MTRIFDKLLGGNSMIISLPTIKFINRVLSGYPLARDLLKQHSGKLVRASVGPLKITMRLTGHGEFEVVGRENVFPDLANTTSANTKADVVFEIPAKLLPRLARGDETALSMVTFTGDSELAAALSLVARNVTWDFEEDLSQMVGDIAAHRIVGTAKTFARNASHARGRFSTNVAEYLTEEKRTFAARRDLESLEIQSENLRDAVARLDAKINAAALRITAADLR